LILGLGDSKFADDVKYRLNKVRIDNKFLLVGNNELESLVKQTASVLKDEACLLHRNGRLFTKLIHSFFHKHLANVVWELAIIRPQKFD